MVSSKVRTALMYTLAFVVGWALPVSAQEVGFQDELLEQLAGVWLMEGTIGGESIQHDVVAEWVLNHGYLQLHEVAREKEPDGLTPAYEAIVTIGWDADSERYVCQWLDSTGGGGLRGDGLGYAVPDGDRLAFLFHFPDGEAFHTTFTYDRSRDTWDWHMIGDKDGDTPFAEVTLRRLTQ